MNSSSRLLITLSCILLVLCIQQTSGLRGCSSFGHSCFGAHGKRVAADGEAAVRQPHRADVGGAENRDYGGPFDMEALGSSGGDRHRGPQPSSPPPSSLSSSAGGGGGGGNNGRYIPFAILRLLKNLANDAEDRTTSRK